MGLSNRWFNSTQQFIFFSDIMPFKPAPKVCKLKECSAIVDSDMFDGYCSKRHLDIAKLQQTEHDIERPTPLTSIAMRSEGHSHERATDIPVRRGYDYTTHYTKVCREFLNYRCAPPYFILSLYFLFTVHR